MPLAHARAGPWPIDCGPRQDRSLLDEDRRLLASVASQAAVAVTPCYLTVELAARLDVIARQAEELAASRARIA